MKTEQEIINSIEKVKTKLAATFKTAIDQFENEEFDECSGTLLTLIVNIAAIEAACRIIR